MIAMNLRILQRVVLPLSFATHCNQMFAVLPFEISLAPLLRLSFSIEACAQVPLIVAEFEH